jgi:hypothetical protein
MLFDKYKEKPDKKTGESNLQLCKFEFVNNSRQNKCSKFQMKPHNFLVNSSYICRQCYQIIRDIEYGNLVGYTAV